MQLHMKAHLLQLVTRFNTYSALCNSVVKAMIFSVTCSTSLVSIVRGSTLMSAKMPPGVNELK